MQETATFISDGSGSERSTSESCSDSTEDAVVLATSASAVLFMNIFSSTADAEIGQRGGSRHGRRPNKERYRAEGAFRVDRDYFCRLEENRNVAPISDDEEFRRRYRVSRGIYEKLRAGILSWKDTYFEQTADCCGAFGATTDQKMWAALRMLAYGTSADQLVEYGRLAESTNLLCLKKFCKGVVAVFEKDWLRLMNENDFDRLSAEYAQLGFPGCIGCVDCASWQWDCCPIAWQGQCRGKEKKRL
jgi:Plant transposon protein